MRHVALRFAFRVAIAAVWLISGLAAKVLGLVPRHEQIVGRILGSGGARGITLTIGLAEVGISVWILSGAYRRFNAVLQIALVLAMNLLEIALAPDLLLFGRWNVFLL